MSWVGKGLAALVGVAVMVACARQRAEAPPLPDLPSGWGAAATTAPVEAWAETFDDPHLIALIREALAANHDLAAAAARVEAAAAELRVSGADRLPRLDANAGATRTQISPSGSEINAFTLGLSASWELDVWGRWRKRSDAASLNLDAVAADRAAAALSLAASVAKAWYAARAASAEVLAAEALVQTQGESVRAAERRFLSGLLDAEVVRELRSSLAAAENRVTAARIARAAQIRRLEILLGRYPSGSLICPADLPAVPPAPASGLPAELVARRPDLIAAEHRFRAALARADAAQADLYPRIALTASGGRSSADLGDILDADFSVWSLGANLVQPLFQGDRLRGSRDRADAEARVSGEVFVATVLRALGEVEIALNTGTLLAERDRLQQRITSEAIALSERAAQRHAAGIGDALDVLAARRGRQEAELNSLAIHVLRIENRIELNLALGGDTLVDPQP